MKTLFSHCSRVDKQDLMGFVKLNFQYVGVSTNKNFGLYGLDLLTYSILMLHIERQQKRVTPQVNKASLSVYMESLFVQNRIQNKFFVPFLPHGMT